jgi:hypothetical protein
MNIVDEVTIELTREAWSFKDASVLVKELVHPCRDCGYYTMIGGSVAHSGFSLKDLDLVFVPVKPFVTNDVAFAIPALLSILQAAGIKDLSITSGHYPEHHKDPTRDIYTGTYQGRRIDCIIIRFPQEGVQP